jgi:hypothetical protein
VTWSFYLSVRTGTVPDFRFWGQSSCVAPRAAVIADDAVDTVPGLNGIKALLDLALQVDTTYLRVIAQTWGFGAFGYGEGLLEGVWVPGPVHSRSPGDSAPVHSSCLTWRTGCKFTARNGLAYSPGRRLRRLTYG